MVLFGFGCSLSMIILFLFLVVSSYQRMRINELEKEMSRLRNGLLLLWKHVLKEDKPISETVESFEDYDFPTNSLVGYPLHSNEKTDCLKKNCQLPSKIQIKPSGNVFDVPLEKQYHPWNSRCNNLSQPECVNTLRCGWLAEQKPSGEWTGRCYPGTTEGPLDPLKSQNPEENSRWTYGHPNPFF